MCAACALSIELQLHALKMLSLASSL
jgi:hypothetical protein